MDTSSLKNVTDWFWRSGSKRKAQYRLGPGTWLDQLYKIADNVERAEQAVKARPSMALWGASQSGKSTLLSRYVDFTATEPAISALQWSSQEKVFFAGSADAEQAKRENWVILNPYNAGADASYCVSRFVVADKVGDEECPVEIRLISHSHLLRFLAHGYHSECDRRMDGAKLIFDQKKFEDLLPASPPGESAPKAFAYRQLHDLADVIESLIAAQLDRFENLAPAWPALRRQLLECPTLNTNESAVEKFAARVLWDGQEDLKDPLSSVYKQLCGETGKIRIPFENKRILCSYRVAKLLLNCDTYHRLSRNLTGDESDNSIKELKEEIRKIKFKINSDEVKIGTSSGDLLFATDEPEEEFARFQAAIRELVFTLNGKLLQKKAPGFFNFLTKCDLLDFPGVARYEKTQILLSRESLAGDSRPKIFTEILKRGKTAAIVSTAGEIPTIDSFCILSKIVDFPPNTAQLSSGVRAWMRGLGYQWPPEQRLPLNLVFTFCGQLIDDVVRNGPAMGMDKAFGKAGILGEISRSEVSAQFLTTYSEFPGKGGKIMSNAGQVSTAREAIATSAYFKGRFAGKIATLDEMINNGGTDYLFSALQEQVESSERLKQIQRQRKVWFQTLKELLAEASPPDGQNAEMRQKEIESWRLGIESVLQRNRQKYPNGNAPADVSSSLRRLLHVEADNLIPIPLDCATMVLDDYIETQFARWRQASLNRGVPLEEIGLDDSAKANRLLGYLCDYAIREAGIIPWIKTNFVSVIEKSEARQARQFLALKIADALAFGGKPRPAHRDFSEASYVSVPDPKSNKVQIRLDGFAFAEQQVASVQSDLSSPHYFGFIWPFLQHLENVRNAGSGGRGRLDGDDELAELVAKLNPQPQFS